EDSYPVDYSDTVSYDDPDAQYYDPDLHRPQDTTPPSTTVATTKAPAPTAPPTTTRRSGGVPAATSRSSSGGPLDGILSEISGGRQSDGDIIGGAAKTLTDMLDLIRNNGLGGTENTTAAPKDAPKAVNLNLAQALTIYSDAVTKAYEKKPRYDKNNLVQVREWESSNPFWHIGGNAALGLILNDELKKDSQQAPIWPERGAVDNNSLFGIKLTSDNVVNMTQPMQSGNVIALEFIVEDPSVRFPTSSPSFSVENIISLLTSAATSVTGRSVNGGMKWSRVLCAIDRSTEQFVILQHVYLLSLTATGNAQWPEPSTINMDLYQGYERFVY
ncbi:MAG: hypothetical protein FWG82_05165, partial [Oscillospiraceae bacterium]|nr:hypothetical protein [Oscillospiraceae bacterium]